MRNMSVDLILRKRYGRNRKMAKIAKNAKVTNFDPLPLKNYDWKKSEKIQGNSWDSYKAI